MAERPKLPRNVWIAGWVSLFNDASSEMIYPLLPLFITGVLKASRSSLGLIEGVAEATASLLKVYSGTLSDRFRTRKLPMFVGYALSLAARPLIAAAGSWEAVFVARFTDRFGKGIRTAPRDAVLADSTPVGIARPRLRCAPRPRHRGRRHRTGGSHGHCWGRCRTTSEPCSGSASSPGVVALVLIAMIRDEVPARAEGQAPPSIRQAFAQGGAFRDFLWVTVLFTLATPPIPSCSSRRSPSGSSVTKVTGVYLLFNLFYAAVSGPIGAFADVWGRRRVTLLSFFYYALVYCGLRVGRRTLGRRGPVRALRALPGRGGGGEKGLRLGAVAARPHGVRDGRLQRGEGHRAPARVPAHGRPVGPVRAGWRLRRQRRSSPPSLASCGWFCWPCDGGGPGRERAARPQGHGEGAAS